MKKGESSLTLAMIEDAKARLMERTGKRADSIRAHPDTFADAIPADMIRGQVVVEDGSQLAGLDVSVDYGMRRGCALVYSKQELELVGKPT